MRREMIDAFGESTTQQSLLEGHAGGIFRSMLSTASVPPSISDVKCSFPSKGRAGSDSLGPGQLEIRIDFCLGQLALVPFRLGGLRPQSASKARALLDLQPSCQRVGPKALGDQCCVRTLKAQQRCLDTLR